MTVPGWYGKLPGMGDFAHRRMGEAFRDVWDRWLQRGMSRLRARHADWTDHYLQAPLWCFVLGEGVVGATSWIGVLMPSVDGVGRYFPFTVAAEIAEPPATLENGALAHARQWWALAAQAALEGLEQDLDAARFDVRLQQLFAGDGVADEAAVDAAAVAAPLALPQPGQSLWFTDPQAASGPGMASRGLPEDDQFDALFGLIADAPPPDHQEDS